MLEGEEVLEAGTETGLRLCLLPSSTSTLGDDELSRRPLTKRVFAAHWDRSDGGRRLYVCYQDGRLELLKLHDKETLKLSSLRREMESPLSASLHTGGMFSPGGENYDSSMDQTMEMEARHAFQIFFRRPLPYEDGKDTTAPISPHDIQNSFGVRETRPIYSHFDRFQTIPSRPGEFIFLVGVTQAIFYSVIPGRDILPAIPFSSGTVLQSVSRTDRSGFIYGSPILEIERHSRRVTALTVSSNGQLCVSGDETGGIRVVVLRQLSVVEGGGKSEIEAIEREEQRKRDFERILAADPFNEPTTTASGLNTDDYMTSNQNAAGTVQKLTACRPFLQSYRLGFQAHSAGVFTAEFVPCEAIERRGTSNYALATGSADRSVRLWQVSYHAVFGLSALPLLNLDTLSVSVLSLTTLRGPSPFSHYSENDTHSRQKSQDVVYLAGGTDIGTIHVWRYNVEALQVKMKINAVAASEGTFEYTRDVSLEDGSAVVAVLQMSDAPIINVSSAHCWGVPRSDNELHNWLLAGADTKGNWNLFGSQSVTDDDFKSNYLGDTNEQTEVLGLDSVLSTLPASLQKRYRHAVRQNRVQKLLKDDPEIRERIVSLTSSQLPTAAVSCSFVPPKIGGLFTLGGVLQGRDTHTYPALFLAGLDGDMRLFADTGRLRLADNFDIDGMSVGTESELGTVVSSTLAAAITPLVPVLDSPHGKVTHSTDRLEKQVRDHLAKRQQLHGPVGRTVEETHIIAQTPPPQSPEEREEIARRLKAHLHSDGTNRSSSSSPNKSAPAVNQSLDSLPEPRAPLTPSPRRLRGGSGKEVTSTRNLSSSIDAERLLPPPTPIAASPRPETTSTASLITRLTAPTQASERRAVSTSTSGGTTTVRSTVTTRTIGNATTTGANSSTSTTMINGATSPRRLNSTRTGMSGADVMTAATEIDDDDTITGGGAAAAVFHARAADIYTAGDNKLAMPSLHSTAHIEKSLAELVTAVENGDALSVSTQHTTQSDRRAALLATRQLNTPRQIPRYSSLVNPRLVEDLAAKDSAPSATPITAKNPAVDSEWQARKRALALPDEDRSILFDMPTPSVSLGLFSTQARELPRARTGGCVDRTALNALKSRFVANRRHGLRAEISNEDGWPRYQLELNEKDLLSMQSPTDDRVSLSGIGEVVVDSEGLFPYGAHVVASAESDRLFSLLG